MKRALLRVCATSALLVVSATAAHAQTSGADKPSLDHDSYDLWNRIAGDQISPDGRWLTYRIVPGEGDGHLVVRDVDSGATLEIPRGNDAGFTDDSRFLVITIEPAEETVDSLRDAREDDRSIPLPNDTLGILDLAEVFGGATPDATVIRRIADVASFRVPAEDAVVLAYQLEPPDEEESDPGQEEEEEPEEEEEEEASPRDQRREDKSDGAVLVLHDLDSGAEYRFEHTTDYLFDEDGSRLYYTASSKDGTADGLFRVETEDGSVTPLLTGEGRYEEVTLSDEEEGTGAVAFLSDRNDQESEEPAFDLYLAGADDDEAAVLVASTAPGMPEGWWVAANGNVRFSDSGRRIFFGARERPEPEPEEDDGDEDEEDEVVLDVWNWKDDYLQPMQLIQARNADERTYDAVVEVGSGDVVQLETVDFDNVDVSLGGDGALAVGSDDRPYRQLVSWDGRYNDIYLVDVATGERELVIEQLGGRASFTPDGSRLAWWDGVEKHWKAMDVETKAVTNLTAGLPHPVHDVLDDHPDEPPSYGSAGWTEDGRFVVYDAHDIWLVDPEGDADPRNLTEGVGRREGLRFRYLNMDFDSDFVPMDEDVLLTAFHLTRKDDGFYQDRFDDTSPPARLVLSAHSYGRPDKAEDADRYLLTRETFQEFDDLYVTDTDFSAFERMSEANPQQDDFRWGTAEIYEWMSADRIPLQGILYKPEGFDPSQQYPMMVYFYERSSDGLHSYTVPSAGSSSINRSFYVSRGYLLFVPDIPYEIGFPGESAVDAVVPGVLGLIDEGFVDPDRIGVQGHSWGGYQIAHMVTRSDIFAAAEAGAPVVNMTSAYGGIRWGSGMSRMFQYERTQSRIGGTLWDAQHRFIENSPLFFADKVNTPLLMLHNDEDGAVPWYQGIEMFVALRRLEKPVWMLNYNGEDHGLRQEQNQRDWAIRMQQFFDHYLMDAPPPVWLEEGVPALLKGETLGLELVTGPITEEGGSGGG